MKYLYKSMYYKSTVYCVAYGGNPWDKLNRQVGARRVRQFAIDINKQFS